MVNAEEDHAEIVITTSIPMFALCTIVSPECIILICNKNTKNTKTFIPCLN